MEGNVISEKALKVAMLDSMLQSDERRSKILIEQLRDKNAELTRIQKEIKKLAADLMIKQRQIAALTDAISLEMTNADSPHY